jgi:tripeptide aminopeptidase
MAHVDTAPDLTGKNVRPQVVENYDGGPIRLNETYTLDPKEFPELAGYVGGTIITTDGTTLLGADDKAGVAEIMSAVAFLQAHPEIPHGPIEIYFTPDEEIGKGMDRFPRDMAKAEFCYTLDGGDEGTVEAECFTAFKVEVNFHGKVIHLGSARGKLANAVTMAATYVSMLPRSESPESTDGRYGYYCPLEIRGDLDHAWLEVYLRDFELSEITRRVAYMESLARTIEGSFPGSTVELKAEKQYLNMREELEKRPEVIDYLKEAIRQTGMEPDLQIIRGGTDGARFTEMGVPTPNVFAGSHNMHSRFEWVAVATMARATHTIVNLVQLWSRSRQ